MNNDDWQRRIIVALTNMGDAQYQRRSWSGRGPEVSSPEEVICALFDDNMFMNYIERHREQLPSDVPALAQTLSEHIEALDADMLAGPAEHIVDDPRWGAIRDIAKELRASLQIRGTPY